jgi:hypothetical protein
MLVLGKVDIAVEVEELVGQLYYLLVKQLFYEEI